ncbi:hypothetical protein MIND_01344800 [Mycena indigotica]|uniref:DUF7330 domain-containing protein n=1 Tax=Mycena indigotica TaxID=2126181 RepID=A0A8H6RZ86_9AGAR|nr:uncharacterized protein MIND_01344800 [Mycena indigotica]KAF7289716.1 hypothetical protein MIND_01344800 [Mycena indigotica]
MIIVPEFDLKDPGHASLDAKAVEPQLPSVVNRVEIPYADDPPPAYNAPASPPPPLSPSLAPPPPLDVRPTNHFSLSKPDGRIRGSYVIDPSLKIPAQMLAPLEKDETEKTRRNLSLHTHDGSIDANVWVLSDDGADCKCRGRVRVNVRTEDGNVGLRLHSTAPNAYTPRTPIQLSLRTADGHISLALPRSFTGPLTIRLADGRKRFSPAFSAATTVFSESHGVSRCFVGDFANSGWADAPGDWTGDEAEVVSDDGGLRIEFDDEKREKEICREEERSENGKGKGKGKAKGLFGRLMST